MKCHIRPCPRGARKLRGIVPLHFEQFYRATLRFVPGRRLRTLQIAELYAAWATENGKPSINLKELKRAMGNIGHRAKNLAGMKYCDVVLAADWPNLPDNYPAIANVTESRTVELASKLDAMITDLTAIRAEVAAANGLN